MANPPNYALLLVALLTAVAAIWDLRTGEIPNRLIAIGAGLCGLALMVSGSGNVLATLLSMLLGVTLVALVPFLLFRAGGIGGGDVKLLALVGLALGPALGLQTELYAFVAALLYAPLRLIWDGKLVHALKTMGVLLVRPFLPAHRKPAPVPPEELTVLRFGPAIFVGTLLTAIQVIGAAR
jgi:Flp pilus assembly protein protease CpaA